VTAPPPGFWHGSWATGPAPATTGGTERTSGWDVLLVSLAGVVLVTTWRVQDLFPILATVQFPLVAAAAAYGTYFLDRGRLRRHPVTTLAIVLFVLMMASVPWSVYPGLSFRFIFNDHIKTLLMMLLIAASIRRVTDVQRLANVLVVGASLYAFVVLTSVRVGESGRLGELWYYDANDLGMLLAATLPLMIYAVRPGVSLTRRLLGLVGICLAMLTIVKTGSRGGFLALLACGAYLLFGFQAIPKRVRVASVALVAVLFVALANDHYWDMMGTLLHPTQDYNWTGKNEVGRMEIWKRGIGYMLGRPLVGVGANAFPVAEGTISPLAGRQAIGIGLKWPLGLPGDVVPGGTYPLAHRSAGAGVAGREAGAGACAGPDRHAHRLLRRRVLFVPGVFPLSVRGVGDSRRTREGHAPLGYDGGGRARCPPGPRGLTAGTAASRDAALGW